MERYVFNTKMVGKVLMVVSPSGELVKMPLKELERERLRREFAIQEMEQKYDALIERLEGLTPFSQQYNEALTELGAFESKMRVLLQPQVSGALMRGMDEVSTTAIRYMCLS